MLAVEYTTRQGKANSFHVKQYYNDGTPFMLAFDLNDDSIPDLTPRTARGRKFRSTRGRKFRTTGKHKTKYRRRVKRHKY